jgi:hypothetical protein
VKITANSFPGRTNTEYGLNLLAKSNRTRQCRESTPQSLAIMFGMLAEWSPLAISQRICQSTIRVEDGVMYKVAFVALATSALIIEVASAAPNTNNHAAVNVPS